jgi:glutaminyl-tRNA synthetase
VAKRDNVIDVALLEHSIREDLNKRSLRRMAVINPVKLVIDNYPDDEVEYLDAINNPEDPEAGTAKCRSQKNYILSGKILWKTPLPNFSGLNPAER